MFSRRIRTRYFVACFGFALLVALALTPAYAGGGNVLPPTASPHGFSLEDMAQAMADFQTSGRTSPYPDVPFQILYTVGNASTGTFHVKTGTQLFVPIAFNDNSPPVLGDFPYPPADSSTVQNYWTSPQQMGAHDMWISVDGVQTPIDASYLAGPVRTPPLPDGGGTYFMQQGVFLTPLSKGTHTVEIHGVFNGAAVLPYFGPNGLEFTLTYTVIVH